MDEFFAIKCQNCGGPMYSHQASRSFECAYAERPYRGPLVLEA